MADIFTKDKYLEVMLEEAVYAIEVEKVIEILRMQEIRKIHGQPDYMVGTIDFRGEAIPLINLRNRFGMEMKDYDESTCIVTIETLQQKYGLIVDGVRNMTHIEEEKIVQSDIFNAKLVNRFIKGVASMDGHIALLDGNKIVSEEELKESKKLISGGKEHVNE